MSNLCYSDFSSRNSNSNTNPFFDFITGFVPRKLRDLFRWCEYLVYNSAHIYAAVKKFGQYPVTQLVYNTTNEAQKRRYEELLEKHLKMRSIALQCSFDKYVYGNAFISVYQPFVRYLQCPKCTTLTNIKHAEYDFELKGLKFKYTCKSCNSRVNGKAKDKKLAAPKRINIIRWDPKLMDIEHNPMTGESVYYYTIPSDLKTKIKKGNKHILNSTPLPFIKAVADDKTFKFNEDAIFHLKVSGPAGIDAQWGFPPLTATIKLFFYTAILRKANEAIALEHIVPFRVMHPQQASGNADPVRMLDMEDFNSQLKSNISKWRQDPNHIMFSPVPVGVTNVGGEGRALLTIAEVQEAEKNIIAAMGIPQEFLYGGLTKAGMEATLRMLENQLQGDIDDLNDVAQWIADKCAKFLGWQRIDIHWQDFKMVDDTETKNLMLSLSKAGGAGVVSDTTLAQTFDIDLEKEREYKIQEELDNARSDMKLNIEMAQLEQSLQAQAQHAAVGLNYDQQRVIAEADKLVQELLGMPYEQRRSYLAQLQSEDMVLYAVTVVRLRQAHDQGGGEAPA